MGTEHPYVEAIWRNYYSGSGAGNPRVPAHLPRLIDGVMEGLIGLASLRGSEDGDLDLLGRQALLCWKMMMRLEEVCRALQARGKELATELRASEDGALIHDAEWIEQRLDDGELPYANSEICPVASGGRMQVRVYGHSNVVVKFGEESLRLYEELDEYGSIAMQWAMALSQSASQLFARVGPPPE